jgi:hypothetical protein
MYLITTFGEKIRVFFLKTITMKNCCVKCTIARQFSSIFYGENNSKILTLAPANLNSHWQPFLKGI